MTDHIMFRCAKIVHGKIDLVYTSLAECLQTQPEHNYINVDVLFESWQSDNRYRVICKRAEPCIRKKYSDVVYAMHSRLITYIRRSQRYYAEVIIIKYLDDDFDQPCDITLDDRYLRDLKRYWCDEFKRAA